VIVGITGTVEVDLFTPLQKYVIINELLVDSKPVNDGERNSTDVQL